MKNSLGLDVFRNNIRKSHLSVSQSSRPLKGATKVNCLRAVKTGAKLTPGFKLNEARN